MTWGGGFFPNVLGKVPQAVCGRGINYGRFLTFHVNVRENKNLKSFNMVWGSWPQPGFLIFINPVPKK